MVHSSVHYVPINGYREDNDDFQRYVRDLNVLLTYKQILNMFASKIRQTYTHFSLALQANGIPRNMIPRLEEDAGGLAIALNLVCSSEIEDTVIIFRNEILEEMGFSNLLQLW